MFDSSKLHTAHGLPFHHVRPPCFFGLDIRPHSWDLLIGDLVLSPVSNRRILRLVFAGKLDDEQECIGVASAYRVRWGIGDSRPEYHLCERMQKACEKAGIEMWRCAYNTYPSDVKVTRNDAERMLRVDKSHTTDDVMHLFQTGEIAVPVNFSELTGGAFMKEVTGPNRLLTKWHGRDCYAWEPNGPDHALNALNYLNLAVEISGLRSYAMADDRIEMVETDDLLEQNRSADIAPDDYDYPDIIVM